MSTLAEKVLIGHLITNSALLTECEQLKPGMFEKDFGVGSIYNIILSLVDNGEEVNYQSIMNHNTTKYSSQELYDVLSECVDYSMGSSWLTTPTKTLVESIITEWRVRELDKCVNKYKDTISAKNVKKIMAEIESTLEDLEVGAEVKIATAKDVANKYKDSFFTKDKKPLLNTGFANLDKYFVGAEGGDLVAIGARPSNGKSAFAQNLIVYFTQERKLRVGYYSLEMPEKQIYQRFIAYLSEIDMPRIRTATGFVDDEEERYLDANEQFSQLDLDIICNKSDLGDITRSIAHRRYDVVVIDYLQLITIENAGKKTRAEEVGTISRALKCLAMKLNIPIIILSQLNRASEMRQNKEPTMSEMRESGNIEQDCSIIALIWQANDEDGQRMVKIEKNRDGAKGRVQFNFDGPHLKFSEAVDGFVNSKESPFT